MKKASRLDYAYAVGRVRVLERDLVETAAFKEAAESVDFASALKVIYDAGKFSDEMPKLLTSSDLDDFLDREAQLLHLTISEILLEEEIREVFSSDDSPEEGLQIAARTAYPFLQDYMKHKIDLGNIKIFCRLKYAGLPAVRFQENLLKGGFLDPNIFFQDYEKAFADIGTRLQASPYTDVWNVGTDALEESETFVPLEREMENFLMAYIKKAKFIVFGPEPVFAYGLAKKKELDLIRLIGVGKSNSIPPHFLKERLSETYV